MIKFGSVCSGIEAASIAWNPIGWEAAWFSEIEPFPCKVLEHHYPTIPNYGDMTLLPERIRSGSIEVPDIFCGGTPCQAFSVAGKRQSLDDARGNLTLTFCEIADELDTTRLVRGEQPTIIFWENVPGVLSTKDNAFGCFLGQLAGENCELQPPGGRWSNAGCVLGPKRAIAWRVTDAKYFGVAQRRRRVFVVATARNDIDPAAILFEFDGVRRDIAPIPEARKDTPSDVGEGFTATSFAQYSAGVGTLRANGGDLGGGSETLAVLASGAGAVGTLGAAQGQKLWLGNQEAFSGDFHVIHGTQDPCVSESIAFALGRNNGGENVVCYGSAGNTIGRKPENGGNGNGYGFEVGYTLTKTDIHGVCSFTCSEVGPTMGSSGPPYSRTGNERVESEALAITGMKVRRLTPVECERLQGFPDGYTDIKPNGKPTPDGPRYKALGNSWAVPNVRWIGERINKYMQLGVR